MMLVSSQKLVLDHLMISLSIFFFILIACLLDIVLISREEILAWSLVGVKWFMATFRGVRVRIQCTTKIVFNILWKLTKYIDLAKPKSGARIFFPTRLFNKTMDNMHVSMDFHLQLLHVHVEN